MDELERKKKEKVATEMMRRDLRVIRETNDENLGPEDDRIAAIRARCIDAGYDDDRPEAIDPRFLPARYGNTLI